MEPPKITCEEFKKRMVDLCLRSGLTEFPTKRRDQLIILKSVAIAFDQGRIYSEAEVNTLIKKWLSQMSCFPGWDHITLRRRLVDEDFLTRNQDGTGYKVSPGGPTEIMFDPSIDGIEVGEVLTEGERLIAQRKAAYTQG